MANKIEQLVRFYVKRYLTEVVNDLDALIERKIRSRLDLVTLLKEDAPEVPVPAAAVVVTEEKASPRRKLTPADLGIEEGAWASVYEDTINSGNPILHEGSVSPEETPSAERPEHHSEAELQAAGLLKDYSKHLALTEQKDRQKQGDAELELKRREILQKTVG